ncbi:T9SS type A sorting domain-containing protein [Candidatus Latescibacterota bacterium]
MKKVIFVVFAVMMLASVSFAAWNPTPMVLTVQDVITYPFDGTDVDFIVDVSGKAAKAYLFINTRLTDKPVDLTNGHLGWHYVNKIDTTIYVSRAYDLPIGKVNVIPWDGVGSENTCKAYMGTIEPSTMVAPGTYDYYVWGYDDKNPRETVCNYLALSFYWYSQYTRVGEWNDDGTPRATPYLWGNVAWMYGDLHAAKIDGVVTGPKEGWNAWGPPNWTAFKFPIGSDPDDMTALVTTYMPGFSNTPVDELDASPITFDPTDEMVFYCMHDYVSQRNGAMFKWNWVSGGDATMVDGWGGWDDSPIKTESERGMGEYYCASSTDGNYIFITSPGRDPETKWDKFYVVNFDGEVIADQMLDNFYTPEHPWPKYRNGIVNRMFAAIDVPNQAVMGGEQHCMMLMAGTDRIANGDEDYVKWINQNGDYFLDAGWNVSDTEADLLWECNDGEYRTKNMGRRYEQWFDRNGIVVHHPDYQGLMSLVVYTQDGSGVAYCKFADDTVSASGTGSARKSSGQRCDNGSSYDGIYTGHVLTADSGYGTDAQNINWIASDSARGIITDKPLHVNEEKPKAFEVDTPYPNPANPSTTIGFTLPKTGHVTIDIYNVAGQKIKTLTDGEFAAGKHSVVWDGAAYPTGVYFYTVRSGGSSETMKVTLFK